MKKFKFIRIILYLLVFFLLMNLPNFLFAYNGSLSIKSGAEIKVRNNNDSNTELRIVGSLKSSGTVTVEASAIDSIISVTNDWDNTTGIVDCNAGEVVLTNSEVSPSTTSVFGHNSFYSFKCEVPSRTLVFQSGSTQTIKRTLSFKGDAEDNPLYLMPSIDNYRWMVDLPHSGGSQYGVQFATFVYVKDSNVISANRYYVRCTSSTGVNTNTRWVFLGLFSPGTIIWAHTPLDTGNIGCTYNTRPKLFAFVDLTGVDSFDEVEIELATDEDFGVNVSTMSQLGWSFPLIDASTNVYNSRPGNIFEVEAVPNIDPDTDLLSASARYVRLRAKDNYGTWSVWSSSMVIKVVSPLWTNDPVQAINSVIRSKHFDDLYTRINNARLFRGLDVWNVIEDNELVSSWAEEVIDGSVIRAAHARILRTKLDEILNLNGMSGFSFDWDVGDIDPGGGTVIRANHIQQMRDNLELP